MPLSPDGPRSAALTLVIGALLTLASPAGGQAPAARAPAFKGIWEPVSYSEDLDLADVFFVTTDIGWASGEGGTILHTRDGGATWTAQLGGDPASTDYRIDRLRFLDEYRGWAIQDKKLLHTADGESWEEIGTFPFRPGDLAFVSARRGVVALGATAQSYPDQVQLTTDGGRTWKPVAACVVKVTIDGLNRTLRCQIEQFHFPSATVGYFVARVQCVGMGCGGPPILGKTEDGGESWQLLIGPGDVKLTALRDLFFTDEATGVVTASDRKVYLTTDGGATWRGIVATPGTWTRFADPEVGWSFHEHHLSYTVDGGKRWLSRPHRFPAIPRAVSFPRRDRAYVAGDHGMVFRYRVVPASAPTAPDVIVTAAMPAFASPVEEEAARVAAVVDELEAAVAKAPGEGAPNGGATPPDGAASADPPSPEEVVAQVPSGFAGACCAQPLNKLGLVITALGRSLPAFLAQYRNTNLLAAGLRMMTDLPGRFGDLRAALGAFKQAGDKAAAEAALARIEAAAAELHQSARAAFQSEVPPPTPDTAEPGAGLEAAAALPAGDSAAAAARPAADAAKQVRKGLGGLIRKKVRIP